MSLALWAAWGLLLFGQASDPAGTVRAILAESDAQTELPEVETPVEARSSPERSHRSSDSGLTLPPALVAVAVWGAVIVGLLLIAALLYQTLRGDGSVAAQPKHDRSGTGRVSEPSAVFPLPDPRALADAGRFAEAIHALFLHVLRGLTLRGLTGAGGRVAPGATGREIVQTATLDPAPRRALASLVQVVEGCRFGESIPERADYESCVRLSGALRADPADPAELTNPAGQG